MDDICQGCHIIFKYFRRFNFIKIFLKKLFKEWVNRVVLLLVNVNAMNLFSDGYGRFARLGNVGRLIERSWSGRSPEWKWRRPWSNFFFVSAFVPFSRQFFFFLPTISIRFDSFAVCYANFMQMRCGEMSEIFVWKNRFRLEFDFNSIFLNFWHFLTILTKLILCKFMQIYANETRKNS